MFTRPGILVDAFPSHFGEHGLVVMGFHRAFFLVFFGQLVQGCILTNSKGRYDVQRSFLNPPMLGISWFCWWESRKW